MSRHVKLFTCWPYVLLFSMILLVGGSFSSCVKKEKYPDEPVIEFIDLIKVNNALGVDEKGILVFSFTDGDGDLGLEQGDTFPPFNRQSEYYYNLFIDFYELQMDSLVKIPLEIPMHQRIPNLTPEGQSKAIKGEIEAELFINNPLSPYDTIAFEFYIYDRALNKSNVVRTPLIVIKKQ